MDIKGFRNIRQIKEAQNIPFLYCLILKSISNKRLGETEQTCTGNAGIMQCDKKQQKKIQFAEAKKHLSFSYNLIHLLYLFPKAIQALVFEAL